VKWGARVLRSEVSVERVLITLIQVGPDTCPQVSRDSVVWVTRFGTHTNMPLVGAQMSVASPPLASVLSFSSFRFLGDHTGDMPKIFEMMPLAEDARESSCSRAAASASDAASAAAAFLQKKGR